MKIKGKDKHLCSTFVLGTHLTLHIVLFALLFISLGIPSVEKYLEQETIVILSEKKTNGIEAPVITFILKAGKMAGKTSPGQHFQCSSIANG